MPDAIAKLFQKSPQAELKARARSTEAPADNAAFGQELKKLRDRKSQAEQASKPEARSKTTEKSAKSKKTDRDQTASGANDSSEAVTDSAEASSSQDAEPYPPADDSMASIALGAPPQADAKPEAKPAGEADAARVDPSLLAPPAVATPAVAVDSSDAEASKSPGETAPGAVGTSNAVAQLADEAGTMRTDASAAKSEQGPTDEAATSDKKATVIKAGDSKPVEPRAAEPAPGLFDAPVSKQATKPALPPREETPAQPPSDSTAAVESTNTNASAIKSTDSSSLLSVAAPQNVAPGHSASPSAAPAAPAASPEAHFAEVNHPRIVTGMRVELLPKGGSMQIRLDPPEMGALVVSVQMRDGTLTASFQTSNDEATKLLSHSLSQLKTSLESQGVMVDKLHVQQAPRDQQSANDEQRQPGDQQQNSAWQEQQRKQMLQRMWERVALGSDPLDMVA